MLGIYSFYFYFYYLIFNNFISIYLFLTVLGLHCCMDFSLVVMNRGYSLVAVCGLLTALAPLVVGRGP